MAWTLTNNLGAPIDLGTVTYEDSNLDAQLFQMPIPSTPDSEAFIIDLFGAFRTITIKGIKTGSASDIATFLQNLDGLVNGSQNMKSYHSDKSNITYSVLVNTVRWSAEAGAVSQVSYEMIMFRGA
jgi:hypothetical protein